MLGYIHLFVVLLLLFAYLLRRKEERQLVIRVSLVFLILIFGSRSIDSTNGAYDLMVYLNYFKKQIASSSILSHTRFEQGYVIFNYVLSWFTNWDQSIFYVAGATSILLTYFFIKKESDDLILSLVIFICLVPLGFYMTAFRQAIAMSLCLVAFHYLLNEKIKIFVLLVLLAMSFHQTAVTFLPMIILTRMKFSLKNVLLLILCSVLFLLSIQVIMLFGNAYFDREYSVSMTLNKTGGLIDIVIMISNIFLLAVMIKKVKSESLRYRYTKLIFPLIAACLLYCARYQALVIERIAFYYIPLLLITVPCVITCYFHGREQKIVRFCSISVLLFLLIWRQGNIPYIPFWK